MTDYQTHIDGLDWQQIGASLSEAGVARLPVLLDGNTCAEMIGLYENQGLFRSRVVMGRHNYGMGEYQYFGDPLPEKVGQLRTAFYEKLAPIANDWHQKLGDEMVFPATHAEFRQVCAEVGQTKPTPLILKYGEGDYNRLHQDLYGEVVFPLQVVILLSQPGVDFEGGELVLVEQRPRLQSRPRVIALQRGQAVVFTTRYRPRLGVRGYHRVNLKHGVSDITRGSRYTLGLIFHDAL